MKPYILFLLLFSHGFAFTTSVYATPELALPKGIINLTPFNAPSIEITDMDGAAFSLARHKGRWVFVHFWASWCGPCRREMPEIQKLISAYKNNNMYFAIINTAEDEDTVFSFLSEHTTNIRPLMDRDGLTTEKWQPRGLPATYLVDPQGVVRYQAIGGRPWSKPAYLEFLNTLIKQN